MVLFTILMLTLLFLVVITVFAIAAGGTVFTILFGDVIVCIFIIGWIIKHMSKKK